MAASGSPIPADRDAPRVRLTVSGPASLLLTRNEARLAEIMTGPVQALSAPGSPGVIHASTGAPSPGAAPLVTDRSPGGSAIQTAPILPQASLPLHPGAGGDSHCVYGNTADRFGSKEPAARARIAERTPTAPPFAPQQQSTR